MTDKFPYTQIRIARPTKKLEKVVDFYKNGLGLNEIGRFDDHDGYSGVMFGLPNESYHLEFTQHKSGSPCPAPTKDNLLVFYLQNNEQRDKVVKRLNEKGYLEVEPENPYWKKNGVTIEDPDGWRIVLMKISSFTTHDNN
ncbi:MAG: VOC family protein [Crocinitomicaceae bacterium]|jgi:catechol 2,3-dioxygenase-like lactoylglutathione lyase family enzyme|nr:VOC family protein [Crocinitomicaceae bacterium]